MSKIVKITAREILDSRANPTVEAEVVLEDGTVATAQVPRGASKGKYEAVELEDNDPSRYHGKGKLEAVKNINEIISPALVGMDSMDIDEADSVMIALDGVHNKSNLGANAILSVSVAIAKAGAMSLKIPLYRYLGGAFLSKMPVPMMNILNGGQHADNNIDIQEFMIIPTGAENFCDGVRTCAEVYHTLKEKLRRGGYSTSVGDEGGFAPTLSSDSEAIEIILSAIEESGYKAERDFMLGLDIASSGWWSDGKYRLAKSDKSYTSEELSEYITGLIEKYPILSIEDSLGEDDTEGWRRLTEKFSEKKLLVGDDLFVTNPKRILEGVRSRVANAVLIKPNQVGSVSETFLASAAARSGGYKTVISHRSADTEDTFIADLAVALGADFIKMGAPARSERTAKYNRLMKIESMMFMPTYGDCRIN